MRQHRQCHKHSRRRGRTRSRSLATYSSLSPFFWLVQPPQHLLAPRMPHHAAHHAPPQSSAPSEYHQYSCSVTPVPRTPLCYRAQWRLQPHHVREAYLVRKLNSSQTLPLPAARQPVPCIPRQVIHKATKIVVANEAHQVANRLVLEVRRHPKLPPELYDDHLRHRRNTSPLASQPAPRSLPNPKPPPAHQAATRLGVFNFPPAPRV
jgi:hypothetical protein